MTSWFMAYCDDCGEDVAAMDEHTRERWASSHYDETDHIVRYWTATSQMLPGMTELSAPDTHQEVA